MWLPEARNPLHQQVRRSELSIVWYIQPPLACFAHIAIRAHDRHAVRREVELSGRYLRGRTR
jgi:hypothetical protein